MKYLLGAFALSLCMNGSVMAWDGFDAATADLVEIIPDKIPVIGDTIEVREYETDAVQPYVVEIVTRNRRTIEVMVRDSSGNRRILVMEGR